MLYNITKLNAIFVKSKYFKVIKTFCEYTQNNVNCKLFLFQEILASTINNVQVILATNLQKLPQFRKIKLCYQEDGTLSAQVYFTQQIKTNLFVKMVLLNIYNLYSFSYGKQMIKNGLTIFNFKSKNHKVKVLCC